MIRKSGKKKIIILIAGGVCLAAFALFLAWRLDWFGVKSTPLQADQPGSAAGSPGRYQISGETAELLQQRALSLLETSPNGLAMWYRLEGRFGQPPSERSADYLAADQLRYGQYLMEQGDRKAFTSWWRDFRSVYLASSGLIRPNASALDTAIRGTGDFWRTNLGAARLLIQSCACWPDRQRRSDLEALSKQLLSEAGQSLAADFTAAVPTTGPILDPAATPTPKPSATPTPSAKQSLSVLRLASLDLLAMRQLAQLDTGWQALYDQSLQIIRGGYLGDALPLYALAYSEKQGGYVYYNGDSPLIDTEETLLVLLHLAETGQDITRSLSWLRDQLYNQDALYRSYHVAQGQAVGSEECLTGYAIVARLSRILSDEDLYQAATGRLLWHQATSQRSAALNAIFQTETDGLIYVTAEENTWALLALR